MTDQIKCPHCNELFLKDEMVEYGGQLVCEDCGYELENSDDENEVE